MKGATLFCGRDLIRHHLRQRFHVTLRDGSQPFEGVLTGVSKTSLEFSAVTFDGHAAASPLFIDRVNVAYFQAVVPSLPAAVIT